MAGRRGEERMDRYVNKKTTRYRVFSRMPRAATAESILIKFGTSTPWADKVIYLKRHRNWSKSWGGGGVRNFAYPIDFATRDYKLATPASTDTSLK